MFLKSKILVRYRIRELRTGRFWNQRAHFFRVSPEVRAWKWISFLLAPVPPPGGSSWAEPDPDWSHNRPKLRPVKRFSCPSPPPTKKCSDKKAKKVKVWSPPRFFRGWFLNWHFELEFFFDCDSHFVKIEAKKRKIWYAVIEMLTSNWFRGVIFNGLLESNDQGSFL